MAGSNSGCPKCGASMEEGFVPDFAHSTILIGSWHAGKPKKSFLRRTDVSFKDGIPIGAFRCSKCGFLELYADQRFAAK